ncbi:MAG: NAD(P)-dependent oxidoreductase [Pararhodobacter sp.]|nr:NAD(P)-dependent oxidoreductase [Pararhodobacter sp.]
MTGSDGLIGTALYAELQARGHALRRFDIADRQAGPGDILAPAALAAAMKGCSGVIHLAAVSRVVWGERDPRKCLETNVTGTRNVIEGVQARAPQPWLIFASSREVYGQSAMLPVSERSPLRPMNHYARSKVAGERDVMKASDDGIRAAILRLSTVYGSTGDHADRLVPAFCRAAVGGLPLRVEGARNSVDITHVADVAAVIANVAEALAAGQSFRPMHLTTGRATSLAGLARLVVRLARSESRIVTALPRDYDVSNFNGDPGLAQAQIGWRPRVSLEAGLAELIARFRQECGQSAKRLTG